MSGTDSERNPVVLVMEDEALVRAAALSIVEESGFEAIGAGSADEAIGALETGSDIHAVFTDVQMPGQWDGVKFARLLRDRWPAIAVLVTSGKTRESELPNGARFVPKPYLAFQIETILRDLLQRY